MRFAFCVSVIYRTVIYDYNNRMQSLPISDHFLWESILQGTGDTKVLKSLLMMSQGRWKHFNFGQIEYSGGVILPCRGCKTVDYSHKARKIWGI